MNYTKPISSNSTRKLLWFEISKMLIAVWKNKFIVLFIVIFGTLSSPVVMPLSVLCSGEQGKLTFRSVMTKFQVFLRHRI